MGNFFKILSACKKNAQTYFLGLCICLIFIGSIFYFSQPTKQITHIPNKHVCSIDRPDIVLKNTTLSVFVKENIEDCKIEAQESKMYPKQNKTECKNITCNLTTKKNMSAYLTAPHALINHETKQLFFQGAISGTLTLKNSQTCTLSNEDVLFNAAEQKIYAKQTKLKFNKELSITAPKSTIDLKTERITLEEGVTTIFRQKSQK